MFNIVGFSLLSLCHTVLTTLILEFNVCVCVCVYTFLYFSVGSFKIASHKIVLAKVRYKLTQVSFCVCPYMSQHSQTCLTNSLFH